jgi:hypothetical protein
VILVLLPVNRKPVAAMPLDAPLYIQNLERAILKEEVVNTLQNRW